jgi:Fur family transcriptional regulator, ferric uptake regulator
MKKVLKKQVLPGQRQTQQRAAVHKVISESDGPLTVNEIHAEVLKTPSRIGIATVYRTVKLLLESHMIRSVVLPSGETRYESASLGHHHHFQCHECGKVFDIDHCPVSLPSGTVIPGGYVVRGHEITMSGTCPKCRKQKK